MGLFTREGEGESLEFGYCFDVSSLDGLMIGIWERCWTGQADGAGVIMTGCDTSFLSGLGVVVRYAIYPLAVDSPGQLVSTN